MRTTYRLTLSFIAAAFLGCSDRDDAILSYNEAPQLWILDGENNSHDVFNDSLRYSDDPPSFYNLRLKMSDRDENLWRCQIVLDSGRVSGYYQGKEMALPSVRVDQEIVELSISPKQTGNNEIKFIAEDRFNEKTEVTLNLYVFDNLKPVAVLENRSITTREYEFSGQGSFDQDERFGGAIAGYEFTIDGVSFQTPSPTVRHVFARPGTYVIRLRVLDNNNAFSDEVETRLTVE